MSISIGEGVWWVNLTGVNAYVVDDDGVLTLVDAGFPWSTRALTTALGKIGRTVGDIERVLVTHYDIDHVGSLGHLDGLEATVYVGRQDAPFVSRQKLPSLSSQKGVFQRAVDWMRPACDLPVEPIEDGDTVGNFTAHHTPGHTRGHTVFTNETHSAAFLGDLVVEYGGRLVPTPWFICEDYGWNVETLCGFAEGIPPFDIAAQGHGVPSVDGGDQRLRECANRLSTRT